MQIDIWLIENLFHEFIQRIYLAYKYMYNFLVFAWLELHPHTKTKHSLGAEPDRAWRYCSMSSTHEDQTFIRFWTRPCMTILLNVFRIRSLQTLQDRPRHNHMQRKPPNVAVSVQGQSHMKTKPPNVAGSVQVQSHAEEASKRCRIGKDGRWVGWE